MRAALVALALALLVAAPAAGALQEPLAPSALTTSVEPTDILLRPDPDGGRTLLLHVEDGVGGTYAYAPSAATPPLVPNVREAGAFTHAYALADGTPMMAAGLYLRSDATGGILRVPLVLVENVRSSAETQAALLSLTGEALQQSGHATPYAQELLLPEMAEHFRGAPSEGSLSTFRDQPTLYVWAVHRTGPAGEVWAGHYLARTGSVEKDASGQVSRAVKDAELGVAARDASGTTRLAGAYVTQTLTAEPGRQSMTLVAGAAAADGARAPLAALRLEDERAGRDAARYPSVQRTGGSVGVEVDGAFVPLAGVETEQRYRPSQHGREVTRVTSAGAFAGGEYVPLAGVRYHSDRGELVPVLTSALLQGPGNKATGDFEVDVGAFPGGEYVPLAGAVYRSTFREARHDHQSLVGAGAYTPLGFVPLVVATYDGSRPLVEWAVASVSGNARGDVWMLAAGSVAAGQYVPVVGVEAVGVAPLGARHQQQEYRVGTFAGSYSTFVPLASVAYDGEETPVNHTARLVGGGGPGARAGAFDARVGAYGPDGYVGVAGVGYRSSHTGGWAAEGLVVLGAYVGNGFVPLVGVAYEGEKPLVPSLGNLGDTRDDSRSRVTVGAFADGRFVPLLRVENGPDAVRVTPVPPA